MDTRYQIYLQSPEWQQRRVGCFIRADHKCEGCEQGGPLQVHHLTYARIFAEPLADLMALCRRCHELVEALISEGKIERMGESPALRIATRNALNGIFPVPPPKIGKKKARDPRPLDERNASSRERISWQRQRHALWKEARKKARKAQAKPSGHYHFKPTKAPRVRY